MKLHVEVALNRHLASHLGVISRNQARAIGIEPSTIQYLLRSGQWQCVRRGVYTRSGTHLPARAQILAVCLTIGPSAVASHSSAAWLWDLLPHAPTEIEVTVARSGPGGKGRLLGTRLHRRYDLIAKDQTSRGPVPVTTPTRTLCDLGESVPRKQLDDAVDRALARRLVAGPSLERAIRRLARRGRRGPAQLRDCLEDLGVLGAPHPSVLESRVARLLRKWGITPLRSEAIVFGGTYRLDYLLAPKLALEVDGFTYHSSPAAKAADTARRNRLTLAGYVVLQTDWLVVTRHPEELRHTIAAALAQRQWA